MVSLSNIDLINGWLTVLMVLIEVIVGLAMIVKYRKTNNRAILFMGLSLICLTSPWIANTIAFFSILFTQKDISAELHLFIGVFFLPIALLFWMVVISELMYRSKQKRIVLITLLYAIFFNSVFIILLLIDPSAVAEFQSPIDVKFSSAISAMILVLLFTTLITSVLFYKKSLDSDTIEAKLKGTFFLLSSTTFVFASILDAVGSGLVILIIARIMLLIAAIFIYWAFLMPKWVKQRFIK